MIMHMIPENHIRDTSMRIPLPLRKDLPCSGHQQLFFADSSTDEKHHSNTIQELIHNYASESVEWGEIPLSNDP
jgi:hypothetical protein